MSKPHNSRRLCQDCLKYCMTVKPTKLTPLMASNKEPFCVKCIGYWTEVPGDRRTTWKCGECQQTMPLLVNEYNPDDVPYISWVHAENCGALHIPCACKVRNRRPPGWRRCVPCAKPVNQAFYKDTLDDLAAMPRKRKSHGRSREGPDPSPWQENAIRALEDK